jgi:hypothetical protein
MPQQTWLTKVGGAESGDSYVFVIGDACIDVHGEIFTKAGKND